MSAAIDDRGSWTTKRWWAVGCGLVVAQVLLLFVFSSRPQVPPLPEAASNRFSLVTRSEASQSLGEVPWVSDPALFALVTTHGFAGPVWYKAQSMPNRPVALTDPSRWLTLSESPLGVALPLLTARRGEGPPSLLPLRPPAFSIPDRTLHPLMGASSLHFEGELKQAKPLSVPNLPSWPHNDVLRPTVVQVVVGRYGSVESAVLFSSSGLAAADQQALVFSRQLRFEKQTGVAASLPWVWGRVVFRWSTQGPKLAATESNSFPPTLSRPVSPRQTARLQAGMSRTQVSDRESNTHGML